jgi:hypothetical protein
MQLNVRKEVTEMEQNTVNQLRDRYAEVFSETTNARNKQWLIKKIIWRLQSIVEGDLSERARARAMEIASDAEIRRRPPKAPDPKPDAVKSPPIPISLNSNVKSSRSGPATRSRPRDAKANGAGVFLHLATRWSTPNSQSIQSRLNRFGRSLNCMYGTKA